MVKENVEKVEFSKFLKEWLRVSKTHGLDRLVLSKRLSLQLTWTVCLIASASLCSFLIGRIISDYLRFEVKTRIREVYSEKIPFPKISICNINPLATEQANEYIRDYFKRNFNVTAKKFSDLFGHEFSPFEELQYLSYIINDPDFNSTLRESFGYDFILQCIYYFEYCDLGLIKYFDIKYGNCFMLNSNKFANGSERKPYEAYLQDYGVRLVMFTGMPENETSSMTSPESDQKGIILRIEDPDYNGMVVLNGIVVSPGTQAHIVLNRVETKNMPYPYSKCVHSESVDSQASRYMKKMGIKYTRQTCMNVCEQINFFNQVNCTNMINMMLPGLRPCVSRDDYEKLNRVGFNFSICNEMCPIECESVAYETSVTYSSWPTYNSYYRALENKITYKYFGNQNITYDVAKQSFASATISYQKIKYTEINETPSMMFVDLVAAIGGMMGLFLGFSLMVLVEFVELGIEFFIHMIQNKMKAAATFSVQKINPQSET